FAATGGVVQDGASNRPMEQPDDQSSRTPSLWRLDDCLLMPWGGRLDPARCVKCNAPSDGEVVVNTYPYDNRRFYSSRYRMPSFYETIMEYAKTNVTIEFFICSAHRKRRRRAMLAIRLLGVAGLMLFMLNIATWQAFEVGALAGFVCLVSVQ